MPNKEGSTRDQQVSVAPCRKAKARSSEATSEDNRKQLEHRTHSRTIKRAEQAASSKIQENTTQTQRKTQPRKHTTTPNKTHHTPDTYTHKLLPTKPHDTNHPSRPRHRLPNLHNHTTLCVHLLCVRKNAHGGASSQQSANTWILDFDCCHKARDSEAQRTCHPGKFMGIRCVCVSRLSISTSFQESHKILRGTVPQILKAVLRSCQTLNVGFKVEGVLAWPPEWRGLFPDLPCDRLYKW